MQKNKPFSIRTKQRPGENIRKRRTGQQAGGCKKVQPAAPDEVIIADSLFTLRLKPKGGAEILLGPDAPKDAIDIYKELFKILKSNCAQLNIDLPKFDPLKMGLSVGASIDWVTMKFRELIVPKRFGYKINIDTRSGKPVFIIYKLLENDEQFNVLEIKHIYTYLKNNNKLLLDLFLEFLAILYWKKNISFWWNSYADEWMRQELDMYEEGGENMEKDSFLDMNSVLDEYNHGEPNNVYNAIINMKDNELSTKDLTCRLKTIKKDKHLRTWMIQACSFLAQPYKMHMYGYVNPELDYDAGLRFEDRSYIVWDDQDLLMHYIQEHVDTEAQEGLFPPVFTINVSQDNLLDIGFLNNGHNWPNDLNKFFTKSFKVIEKYGPVNDRA